MGNLRRVASFLFFSGACALVYQIAWFRELRLVFGGSTAASSAVLAVFMGGLGAGGMILGKRADRAANAFGLYANLELIVAATAGVSPLLVRLAQAIYVGIGGSSTLGSFGATIMRLVLTVIVLGPSTFAMGGTMPAAARAVENASDTNRNRIAVLYGVNTTGAVMGALLANFALIEVFGTQMTLWIACLVNALVGITARAAARAMDKPSTVAEPTADEAPATTAMWFPPLAAAVAGFAFMLMELVWYRMLAPLLGGSSYTLGLILAVALAGIGLGGAIYAFGSRRATLTLFALTCALEALAIAIPYALGDRVAIFALLLVPLAKAGFGGSVLAWSLISVLVVLPAAIVSGYQFPVIIALYGRGAKDVGKDVGRAYLANTLGSIVGSIAGGFGLMPLLTAPHCWQLVVVMLVALAGLSIVLERKAGAIPAAALGACGLLAVFAARGPTSTWRHSGIGAGRASGPTDTRGLIAFQSHWQSIIAWEEDGLESSVALDQNRGYAFVVNGKSDGHIFADRGTQVMSAMLAALIHDNPKNALVIGLGTGSTAGWLAAAPEIERVDVMELEPAILRIAKDCGPANENVLQNPKVHVKLGDAREGLLTSRDHYDIVFSEPSNPYRAGISSLYTIEYYRAVADRLTTDGLFVQWVQTYEVDPFVVATAITTIHEVFPALDVWETEEGDLLLVARAKSHAIDIDKLRARIKEPTYARALEVAWSVDSAEGVLAHFIANGAFVKAVVDNQLGVVNHDDDNQLEFAFARHVGKDNGHMSEDIQTFAHRLDAVTPRTTGAFDRRAVIEQLLVKQAVASAPIDAHIVNAPPDIQELTEAFRSFARFDYAGGLAHWDKIERKPEGPYVRNVLAAAFAVTGDDRLEAALAGVDHPAVRDLMHGVYFGKKGNLEQAIPALVHGFEGARKDPWFSEFAMVEAIGESLELGTQNVAAAHALSAGLAEPFSVERNRNLRTNAYLLLASRSNDPAMCVGAFDKVGPLLFERDVLEARVACYSMAHDPRLPAAEAVFGEFLALSPSFGAGVPTPAAPAGGK